MSSKKKKNIVIDAPFITKFFHNSSCRSLGDMFLTDFAAYIEILGDERYIVDEKVIKFLEENDVDSYTSVSKQKDYLKSLWTMKQTPLIINDTFQVADFPNHPHTTIGEIFLYDPLSYQKIIKDDAFEIKKNIIQFLQKIEINPEFTIREKRYFLKNKWVNQYKVRRPKKLDVHQQEYYRKQDEFDEIIIERELYNQTKADEIEWKEEVSYQVNRKIFQRYSVVFREVEFKFEVDGTKNEEGKWMARISLSWCDIQKKIQGHCGKLYNLELYKLIQRQVNSRHKQIQKERQLDKKLRLQSVAEKKINNEDFLVKTNLFKCFFKDHLVEEIIGSIQVLTSQGEIKLVKAAGAYCVECNCYYILKSEFDRISNEGILLCQVLEKEWYYKYGMPNSIFHGESQSILMRNGYNVKASQGLNELQRRIILKNIMDKGIMKPHKIVSYIDTFIAQKKNLIQYDEAITKWKSDRDFVLQYREKNKREEPIIRIQK